MANQPTTSVIHNTARYVFALLLAHLMTAAANAGDAPAGEHFDRRIAPLLAARCLDCHSGDEPKGGLDLSRRRTAMAGGDSGAVIAPGDPDESLLWEYVAGDEMPPKTPLAEAEKALLLEWISDGAGWGEDPINPFRFSTSTRAGYDWWSLQPIARVEPPEVEETTRSRNAIDRFILRGLEKNGLSPSAAADPRVLVRRLHFDLVGLPPEPEVVDAFARDPSEEAYARLVDSLLASPHYGERWARAWLDVARFGESNGFEYDEPRDNAWPYRNWVIDALNADMPYDEFVRLQLAGDALRPDDSAAMAATGFLVAGPHNTTLPQNTKMRMSMRQDELEDIVAVVGQTFLGLTVNCGRCHDHKFDPLTQKEYYQFASALAGVQHGEREIRDEQYKARQARIAELRRQIDTSQKQLAAIDRRVRGLVLAARREGKSKPPPPPRPIARWDFDGSLRDRIGQLHGTAHGDARLEQGGLLLDGNSHVATTPLEKPLAEKTLEAWVQLDDLSQRGGGIVSLQKADGAVFDAIVYGEREPGRWMAGSDGFRRTQSFSGSEEKDASARPVHVAIVYGKNGRTTGYRDGRPYGNAYQSAGTAEFAAGQCNVVFGMRHAPPGGNRMLRGIIFQAQLYDRALSAEEIAASAANFGDFVSEEEIVARLSDEERTRRGTLKSELAEWSAEVERLRKIPATKMFAVVPKEPGVTHLLDRGDVGSPGEAVAPGGFAALTAVNADFQLPPDAADAKRRIKLAGWITDPDNPLTARVIVNRLWHYHFGRGLVDTPNDFGFNGGRPSHPELLDWLAGELIRGGWRLKPIHRLIVTSATYGQASAARSAAIGVDADNRLLWRKSPRRLEAEAVRDALLAVSGRLDRTVGGRGYRDVRHYKFKGSHFYELLDPTGDGFNRRTIYRFTPRGGRSPFLDTFDCPDPSTTAPRRATTTTPLQALSLLNNPLVFHVADQLAQRVRREAGNDVAGQIGRIYLLAYARPAEPEEIAKATAFAEEHGLPAFCRVVFNTNEFLYVK